MIRSEDLVLRCFRVLHNMEPGHSIQFQNLRSGQHDPHPVRQVSPRTAQSQSEGIVCLVGISYRKTVSDVAMLESRLILARMKFAMLNFSFEFHPIL